MNTLLSQEVCNRFLALPISERADAFNVIMRITVEVTRDLLKHYPEGVDEFLRMVGSQPGRAH